MSPETDSHNQYRSSLGLASAIKEEWHRGTSPDTSAALGEHQELRAHPSIVVDLAYEEYCIRSNAGEKIDLAEFSRL
jgi:hypothetical protein